MKSAILQNIFIREHTWLLWDFIDSFMYLVDKYLFNTCAVPHIMLGVRDIAVNKADRIYIQV